MSTCELRRRDDAGFTLVEVLVALLLLSVVMVSVLPLIISTLRATALTKVQTQAKNLGQERLEQVGTPEQLRERIAEYHRKTSAVADHYQTFDKVVAIPGEGSVDEIFESLSAEIDHRMSAHSTIK